MTGTIGEGPVLRNTVLTIAGTDSSGGAGAGADLKTFLANGTYGMSIITAVTAQNTMGVTAIQEISPAVVRAQLDAVFMDIHPDAVKIGMVSSRELIKVIAERLSHYHARNVVLDTIMVSTSGRTLLKEDAEDALVRYLLPLADVITPNIPEASVLSGRVINNKEDMLYAAREIAGKAWHTAAGTHDREYAGCSRAVLIKGGHLAGCADDLLYGVTWNNTTDRSGKESLDWFCGERINTQNSHGTGCTLSSAIAAYLAKGFPAAQAVGCAKEYLTGALRAGLDLGRGNGPLDHGWNL